MILVHPESRLAAAGVEVVFVCKVSNGVEPHWVINNHTVLLQRQRSTVAAQGFVLTEWQEDNITILNIRVNATTDKNGTEMFCSASYSTHSSTATLLIINGIINVSDC